MIPLQRGSACYFEFNHYFEGVGLKPCMGLVTMRLNFSYCDIEGVIMVDNSPAASSPFSLIPKDSREQVSG